jgi:nicotinamidase-related amidase
MSAPAFYGPARVGTLYVPDTPGATAAGQQARVSPADQDTRRVMLLLVDAQVDFIHADGSLSVPGAIDDTRRTIDWIFRHLDRITTIAASLDTHVPLQIFYPDWWVDGEGRHPAPFTLITADEVDLGVWRPTVEEEWSRAYVHRLEEGSRKVLTIWPYHTMLGTPGHSLTPALYEAIAFHAAARSTRPMFLEKGSIPRTEHYSILEPEVKVPEEPLGTLNQEFIDLVAGHDEVYIAGQAKSHCVLETTRSLINHFAVTRPELIDRYHVLMDCTSSVVHPAVDFEAIAAGEYARWEREHGLRLVTSADSLG